MALNSMQEIFEKAASRSIPFWRVNHHDYPCCHYLYHSHLHYNQSAIQCLFLIWYPL